MAKDRVDVCQPAGAEEHFADHHDGVSAAAVDVDQPVLGIGVGDHFARPADVPGFAFFDLIQLPSDVLQVFLPARMAIHWFLQAWTADGTDKPPTKKERQTSP